MCCCRDRRCRRGCQPCLACLATLRNLSTAVVASTTKIIQQPQSSPLSSRAAIHVAAKVAALIVSFISLHGLKTWRCLINPLLLADRALGVPNPTLFQLLVSRHPYHQRVQCDGVIRAEPYLKWELKLSPRVMVRAPCTSSKGTTVAP